MLAQELVTHEISKTSPVFQRVLVAIDFSDASERALRFAAHMAPDAPQFSAVHVLNSDWRYEMLECPPELDLETKDAQKRLNALIAEAAQSRKIESVLVKHGPVAQVLSVAASNSAADLLVIGTRGRGGFRKLALGSVAEELLRIAPCPVMTIGPAANPSADLCLDTILLATDFGQGSARALPLVLALAARHQSRLILLHMISPMPTTSSNLSAYAPATAAADELGQWKASCRNRAIRELKQWLPRETGLTQEPEFIVGTEFLPEGLLTAAQDTRAGLIVMGANHTNSARVTAHIPWTAVHEVVRYAPCPVLTVAG
jgi:nucleotide-binding universal stress UspA family protein